MTAVRSFALLAAVLVLSGCAAIQRQQAADSKQLLTEAGFRVRVADEPGLPARQLVAQSAGGATVYKFSDPVGCSPQVAPVTAGHPAETPARLALGSMRASTHTESPP